MEEKESEKKKGGGLECKIKRWIGRKKR